MLARSKRGTAKRFSSSGTQEGYRTASMQTRSCRILWQRTTRNRIFAVLLGSLQPPSLGS
jgi:hypothetical protein